jgi:hypothetical protein
MQRNVHLRAETGEVLINGIIEHFENTVVQPALVWIANVHSGSFTDRFKAFQLIDFGRVVLIGGI